MKKRFAILSMLAFHCVIFAQNVKFTYDNAGNRIMREIVLNTKSLQQEEPTKMYYSDMISERNIRIYPNPTKGRLKVEITGYEDSDQCILRVFNLSGHTILSTQATSSWTELDIGSQINGIYILHISLNNQETIWKIIKQ